MIEKFVIFILGSAIVNTVLSIRQSHAGVEIIISGQQIPSMVDFQSSNQIPIKNNSQGQNQKSPNGNPVGSKPIVNSEEMFRNQPIFLNRKEVGLFSPATPMHTNSQYLSNSRQNIQESDLAGLAALRKNLKNAKVASKQQDVIKSKSTSDYKMSDFFEKEFAPKLDKVTNILTDLYRQLKSMEFTRKDEEAANYFSKEYAMNKMKPTQAQERHFYMGQVHSQPLPMIVTSKRHPLEEAMQNILGDPFQERRQVDLKEKNSQMPKFPWFKSDSDLFRNPNTYFNHDKQTKASARNLNPRMIEIEDNIFIDDSALSSKHGNRIFNDIEVIPPKHQFKNSMDKSNNRQTSASNDEKPENHILDGNVIIEQTFIKSNDESDDLQDEEDPTLSKAPSSIGTTKHSDKTYNIEFYQFLENFGNDVLNTALKFEESLVKHRNIEEELHDVTKLLDDNETLEFIL